MDLNCPICHEYFTNVIETPCCSNGYCSQCLSDALKATDGACPHCRTQISFFHCVPNKMVQRMVDELPSECLYCPAKITRSIRDEHIAKCDKRPASQEMMCRNHPLPLTHLCRQEGVYICKTCALVGTHRHHNWKDSQSHSSGNDTLANNNNDVNTDINTDQPVTLPGDRRLEAISYAALVCLDGGRSVNYENLKKILDASNCFVNREDIDSFLDLFPQLNLQRQFPVTQVGNKLDEEEANRQYEALKKVYDETFFNFEGIKITATPISPYLLKGVTNHLYVLLEIIVGKKKEDESKKRPPFSLSIVLDRSGSMAGSKMDKAKDAIKKVIQMLDPEDRLHLIQYDDNAQVVFQGGRSHQAKELENLVDRIQPAGCTNLVAGTKLAYQTLAQDPPHLIKKIFLFSDGCVNSGITDPKTILAEIASYYHDGVGTSAFGIGADFDEKLMKGISESGNGNYFFIDSSDKTQPMLEKAFKGLSRTVASDVFLKVSGYRGAKVNKVNEKDDLLKGTALGDIREKGFKQLLLELDIDPLNHSFPISVLDYELTYLRQDDFIQEGPITGSVQMETTSDESLASTVDDSVLVYLKIYETSEMDKSVLKLVSDSKLDEAIQLKRKVVNILEEIAAIDKIGFAKVLLMRATNRLYEMETMRAQQSSGSYYGGAAASLLQKGLKKEAEEAEDEDMGFGLFD
eukprot:TRINITY_DN949_c0_g1_i1.p1 TRINITY_DN949_c0_g1~~TRINITY_DN949_c0_g1_i1.p1  ORF type:complete len:689 (-),score=205.57 TRINITY_DN949_c0_g1_i1:570-2636(-)